MHERTPNQAASAPSPSSSAQESKAGSRTPLRKATKRLDDAASIKSFARKILLASPMFPRLYADVLASSAPNSNQAKILARNYKKIVATTERTTKSMPAKSCTHIKVTGVRCGSPAMRGEQFCYFHQRMLRTVRGPASRVHHAALLEDNESIQASLVETVNALLRGSIDLKRAELVLRALNTAVRNIRNVHFGLDPERMVREIPDYPTPPLEEVDEQYAEELRRREERKAWDEEIKRVYGNQRPVAAAVPARTTPASQTNATQTNSTQASAAPASAALPTRSCGDGSSTRPGGPEVPGRSAPPLKPDQTQSAPPRKPPVSVKAAPASGRTKAQERPIVAHRASGG